MTVSISKPAVNLREELASKGSVPVAQEAFWFDGDGTETTFVMPKGWKPKFVYALGLLKRPGDLEDYTVSYDGFIYSVVFAVAPAVGDVAVICNREV